MQSIITTWHGPTDHNGARVSAKTSEGAFRCTVAADYGMDGDGNHRRAAEECLKRSGWHGRLVGGSLNGPRMAWVFVTGPSIEVQS